MISCPSCGENYIGETARPFHERVKEDVEGKERSRLSTALGCHRVNAHNGDDFGVTFEILEREPQTSARKALEAFWIQAKDPKINR